MIPKVQYCHAIRHTRMKTRSSYLNNVSCIRLVHMCTGVKVCQYLVDWMREMHHESIPIQLWERIAAQRRSQLSITDQTADVQRQKTTNR
jgi:hypothetical protein